VLPISSIRFVLAAWVVISHFGIPFLREPHDGVLWLVRGFLNSAFNAQAAVIVFFVISGFCIHFPHRSGRGVPSWRRYYARRYIRILVPMGAAVALAAAVGVTVAGMMSSVLWSLVCEEIYYFLYPALLRARDRVGWSAVAAVAWALSLAVVLTDPRAGNYASYGHALNWILGLPCWLLGCQLADRFDSYCQRPVAPGELWMWRGGIWVLSVGLTVVRFHTPIGYPWTLNLYAVCAAFWLEREIRAYQRRPPPALEGPGETSYSIYLTHVQSIVLLHQLPFVSAMPAGVAWILALVMCAGITAIFYQLVERPSHRLARRVLS
jgi:peptidoglycan/LPS O-acetylase OafA/YrhL